MSDHLDSPEVRADLRLDISDFYAFKGNSGTVFIVNVNPLSNPGGFWADHHLTTPPAHHNIKISRAGTVEPDLTFRATFGQPLPGGRQPMTLTMLTGADADDEDACGQIVAEGLTGANALIARKGIQFYAGPAGDPFYIDPNVIAAAEAAIGTGTKLDLSKFDPAHPVNAFGGTNVMGIVIEVPHALTGTGEITCWSEVKIPTDAGGWHQTDRAGQPLAAILGHLDSDAYNGGSPRDDLATFGDAVKALAARVVAVNGGSPDPDAYGAYVRDIYLPDMLRYRVGTTANYGVSVRNGRGLTENAAEVAFRLIFNMAVSDGLDASSATGTLRPRFPYLSAPA